jgi:hypothetical protein
MWAGEFPTLRKQSVELLARALWGLLYVSAVDGAKLGSLWPLRGAVSSYRAALHVRMGDKFISTVNYNSSDDRIKDMNDFTLALRAIGPFVRALTNRRVFEDFFICADTLGARDMARAAIIAQGFFVVEPPGAPVHIGNKASLTQGASRVDATRAVVREHATLASADAVFMASHSGFSKTACAAASAARAAVLCFLRAGAGWRLFDPWAEGLSSGRTL